MICGVLNVQVIDAFYGTPKHGCPLYDAIAIGTERENGSEVCFVAEFNIHNPYSKLYIEGGDHDTLSGSLIINTGSGESSSKKQIMTLIPIDTTHIKKALLEKRSDIIGSAVLEYTRDFNSRQNMVTVHYSLVYKNNRAFLQCIHFTLSMAQLQHTQRVITNLETARLCDI
jgi:hypothetical protein